MKHLATLLCLLASITVLPAQKFDNVWNMGYNWDTDNESESYRLIFDTFPPRLMQKEGEFQIDRAYSSLCDSAGNFQLYTNMCEIADGNGDRIENTDSLMEGFSFDFCKLYGYHRAIDANIMLFSPLKSNKVFSFYKNIKVDTLPTGIQAYTNKLRYHTVEKNIEGFWEVVKKKVELVSDSLVHGELIAVKHGNGRDWWLFIPSANGNKIRMGLLANDSIYIHHTQNIGQVWNNYEGGFQAIFSPDGTKLARYCSYQGLYLFDFDRCSGEFSNPRYFPYIDLEQGINGSVCFSPNGRYLYVADFEYLYQMDLEATDLDASKQLIATYDGYNTGSPTYFSYMQQGPDGRIYSTTSPGTTKAMHIIHRPDLRGAACKMEQHALLFPNPYGNPQNFPYFRLGPLDGSACDTLGLDNRPLADFRPDPSDTSGLAFTFWDNSSYLPTLWQWDFGDGSMSSDTSPNHIFAAPGLYEVCLTVSNALHTDTRCKLVEVRTVSAPVLPALIEAAVWPNPFSDYLDIRLPALPRAPLHAVLLDNLGRRVRSQPISGFDTRLSTGGLPSGLYCWQVWAGERLMGVGKVVKVE